MADRIDPEGSLPSDPVIELLKGGDPARVAHQAGMTIEELYRLRDAYLASRARSARSQDAIFRKIGRNEPCPCGSGLKYKKCCMATHREILSAMDPGEVERRTRRQKEKEAQERRYKQGYELLSQRQYEKARAFALRYIERYPQDDHFYDILVSTAIYMDDLEEAVRWAEARWRASVEEKERFLSQGSRSHDDPEKPVGHSYSPEAWLERYWVAARALAYREGYPSEPDPSILRLVRWLQRADDPGRFPQQWDEGLRARRKALAEPVSALKEIGPEALPYLLPLCTKYGWSALLIPEILAHWGDEVSMRALTDISLFHYPFLSESCLRCLEEHGEAALAYLAEAFDRDALFDPLKIGLISVAGNIGTPRALTWVASLLDHSDRRIVNWAAGVLAKCGYVEALDRIREARRRIGAEPRIDWAVEELEKKAIS